MEIALAAGADGEAEAACAELEDIAARFGTSGLQAAALHARGAVLLATRFSEEALPTLRRACGRWRELDAPYDAAKACLLLAQAYGALEDRDAAERELDAAAIEFDRLGATLDIARVRALRGLGLPNGLTARQVEVLALVAAGRSNRDIAAKLVISEKTVARHLENIFVKLGVSSRSAAAAYAVEHRLASGPRG